MRYMIQLWSDERLGGEAKVELVAAMSDYFEQLANAGVLRSLELLQAGARGARISMAQGARSLEATAPHAGRGRSGAFWIIHVSSKREAIAWAERCPLAEGDVLELRQLYGAADLPAELTSHRVHLELAPLERARRGIVRADSN